MKLFAKNLLFTICIPGAVAVYLPWIIANGRSIAFSPGWSVTGVILLTVGCGMYLWTVWDFATLGQGTPLPMDAPRKLVVRGLYRFVRNPMYLGVLIVILGWAALFREPRLLVYAAGVGVLVHLFVIFYEEPRLRRLFGVDYGLYCQAVGRWFPRFVRRSISPSP
jgi:protein-S-isoprenylcysteine O-methyltransferase Ste14